MNNPSGARFGWLALHLAGALTACAAAAEEINVPDDESTIQAAINAAADDDTIVVEPGEYRETLTLRGKNGITLSGRETARTILLPVISGKPVITLDDTSGITFKNFTVLQADSGVTITNSTDFNIAANVFHLGSSGTAITVSSDSDGNVTHNTFYKNSIGVKRAANDTVIKNNIFADNETAIASSSSTTTNISYNGYYSNTSDGALGTNDITLTDPEFVSVDDEDFHLRAGSPAIDVGSSTDSAYDDSIADLGAYGGTHDDAYPYPVANLEVPSGGVTYDAVNYSVTLQWSDNTDYRVNGYNLYTYIEGVGTAFDRTAPVEIGDDANETLAGAVPVTAAPAAPTIASITPRNQTLTITWSAVTGATAYELRYGVDSTAENILSVGNVTSYALSGLTNGTTYKIRVHAIAQATLHAALTAHDNFLHESYDLSNEITQAIGPAYTSDPSAEQTGMPEATVSYPLLPNEGCFIATAAYGHYSAPQVQALRDFRDRYLMRFAAGRAFVDWYYSYGSVGAHLLNEYPTLKAPVRVALYPLVFGALLLTQYPGWMLILAGLSLMLVCGVVIHRYRKRTSCTGPAVSL